MVLFKKIKDLTVYLNTIRATGKAIGFVPTMGALHQGHLSLIQSSKNQADVTVCSIFVNPTQFNDANDFEKYPVTIEDDILKLEQQGTDILFLPSPNEMYPDGTALKQKYELGMLENILEGFFRPGHFQGVCQVVDRLFGIVQPGRVFFGQKDYQQCMVINKLIAEKHSFIKMYIEPTLREANGLAMSSRNMRLKPAERLQATAMYKALLHIQTNAYNTGINDLKKEACDILYDAGFTKIDYIEIADAETLQPLEKWPETGNVVVLGAAFLGSVRLIDNLVTAATTMPA